MNDSKLEIKEQRKGLFAKGITYLFLMITSLLIAFLPLLYSNFKSNALIFYIIGGIAFALFSFLFAFLLYKECNPRNALIINSHGFKAIKHVGADIEIEWTNVASVKMLGKKETPFLGISLENCDIVIAKMGKKEADEMRENIEENLPHILISQNELRTPVREIKDLFVKFVRESRALENDVPKKTKVNPFSTDDVLRAFGQLPKEPDRKIENTSDTPESDSKPDTSESNQAINNPFPKETENTETSNNTSAAPIQNNDSFYSLLKQQLDLPDKNISDVEKDDIQSPINEHEANVEFTQPNDIENSNDNTEKMPEELLEILSRAKSSKIDELGKMLNNNAPVSFSQKHTVESNKVIDNEAHISILDDEQNDTVFGCLLDEDMLDMSSSANEQSNEESEPDSFKIILPDEFYDEKPIDDDMEISFESLLTLNNNAPIDASENNRDHDDKTDTKEFYPDLFKINGNEKSKNSDADDELIIPDLGDYNE